MNSRLHQNSLSKMLNVLKKRTIRIFLQMTVLFILISCSTPKLVLDSHVYNFVDAEIGKTVAKDIIIENKGNGTLKINNIDISGKRYSQKNQDDEILIYPNQKYVLNLQFSPDELGNYSGIVSIYSNDPSNKVMNVQLQGKGVEPKVPEIKVLTATLDFLKVNKDSIQTKTVFISNTGNAELVIDKLILNGDGFTLDKPNKNKLVISPDQSLSVLIGFKPLKPGSFSGVLSIYSNDNENKITSVSLKGEGFETKKDINKSIVSPNKISWPSNDTIPKYNEPSYKNNAKNNYLGIFTHDDVKGTMKIQEGSIQKNSEISFSFEVQKTGDFEILITPGYDLVSNEFTFTNISTFTDKSHYKRFVREKVQPNSSFKVVIKRKDNSPDNYKFIFKLFPR
jgi:hypothetical protein